MNKKSIKKLLSYASDELPLATLGVIKGILESRDEGKYVEAFDCLEEIIMVMEAFEELQESEDEECANGIKEEIERLEIPTNRHHWGGLEKKKYERKD